MIENLTKKIIFLMWNYVEIRFTQRLTQGDYIIKQQQLQKVYNNQSFFQQIFLLFIYLHLAHACLLGLQLTVDNVIFSQKVQLLYLALFVLNLIRFKGSVLKKLNGKSCIQAAIMMEENIFKRLIILC
ncbi:unnamed protein product [Paramecium octaurelia]|uniref:Transmembrane protein n=1 Tax=Paramecium octaurelia TaxID=43137 RepID=A0A8S1SHV5_PAROT|nr:unnamed protein product [Paramecium octaurelia]